MLMLMACIGFVPDSDRNLFSILDGWMAQVIHLWRILTPQQSAPTLTTMEGSSRLSSSLDPTPEMKNWMESLLLI